MSDKKTSTLTYIQEMFEDKVEEDVINLVFSECQYNVEKTVMKLLNLTSESMTNKSSVGDSSSTSHKLDDIDPVDTPLPVLPQYFSPTTKDVSELLSKTQYSDVCFTKPVPLDDDSTPGTARPVFPNYLAGENENFFGAKPFSPTVPNVQYDFKLGSGFTENELYVSDDDIDEHIDFIDSIDPFQKIEKNDKVDYDGVNRSNVKDKNTVKNVEQNVSTNVSKNKSSDHQSFLNDKIVRPNTPQLSMHSGSRTFTRHPFGPQFSFPPNQASYFANQARYFPTSPRPFIQPRRNTPPVQYQRPPFPAFRPPMPHHFPPRNTNCGSKAPNRCVPATSMAADNKETGHSSPETIMADSNKRSKHSRQTFSMTSDTKGENRPPLTITATDGNRESNHPAPTSTMTSCSKRYNQPPLTSTVTYGNKGSSHPTPPSTMANGTKEPSQSGFATSMDRKGPTPPIPVTTTHTSKGPSPPIPATSTHTTKGPSPPFSVTSTPTNKALSPPTQLTFTQTSKPPSHPLLTISTYGSTVLNHPKQTVSKTFGSKGSNHSAPATSMSFSNKGSNHIHKGYGHTQTRMQAKFSSYETKSLIILRGLPGSGKSTLARHLAAKGGMIISTDDYFTKGNRYSFNPEELSNAHEWNQNRAKAFMEAGFGPLIIDNTNTQAWEMRPYVLTGLKCGYKVDIKEPETWWKWNIKELERRNTHDVPAKILESMLERYEKNVTVEKIVQTGGQPTKPSKSNNGGESIENTAKYKTNNKHETTYSENKPFTENGKLPKANGNLEPKKPTSKKKTISLSANFASPLDRSKRSPMNKSSKKQAGKANARMNPSGNRFDVLAKSADMNTNSDSTIKFSLPLASADVSRDKPEASAQGCVTQKNVNSETALSASLKSEFSNEETSNKGDSALQYSSEIDTSESKSIQSGDTLGDEVHLEDVSHEDNSSLSEPSVSIQPGFETSVLDDKTLATKSLSESSPSQQAFKEVHALNEVKENEETYAQQDISDTLSSQQTLCRSEDLHSEGSTTAKPGLKEPSNDEGTDLRSDSNAHPSPDIPDGELIESSLRKKQEVDLDNSECDTKFVNIDKEAVSPQILSQVPVAGNAVQCINDELSLTESDTLVPNLIEYSSSISDITSQVPDKRYKNVKLSVDVQSPLRKLQKSTNNSSLPSNDLHHFKVETQTAAKIEHSLCVDIPMIDERDSNIDVNNKEAISTVNLEGDQCGSNTCVRRDSNCKETQAKSSLDVFDLKTNIPDVNCRMQEHAQKSDTKLSEADMKNSSTNTHSDSSVKQTKPEVQDVFVHSNSDVRSGSEPDVPNTVAVSVSESSGRNSYIDTTSCSSMNTVREQPIITAHDFSFRSDTSTIVDRSSVKHFSHNDLEQADCNTVDSAGSKMDVNTCIKMGNPLMDGTKTKVNEAEFKITDNDVKCKDFDMLSPTTSKNETLDPIQFLKDCFPHTEVDLLKSFLNSCDGDLLKTVDSLLEYNENDYQSVTSVCYDKHEELPREVLGINSPESSSIRLAENSLQDHTASPNVNRTRNLALTPEHQSSFGTAEGKSPISGLTSTPRKFRDNIVQSLQLTLDPALALQLLEMFGAFSGVSAKDLLSESDRSIKVDKEFAKVLYTKWRKSVQARNKAKKAEETKKLSPGIGSPDNNTRRKSKTPLRQFYLPATVPENPGKHVVPRPEPVSLKEIMDEQYAIGVCQSDQEAEKRFVEEQLDLSTKLERKRLHGMFPDVDAVALNEIFQANNYDLNTTIMQVQSSCGMPLTGQSTTVADTKEQSFANHQSSSVRQIEFEAEKSTEHGAEVVGNFQSLNDPSYQDYRAEALTHFEQRTECIKKAALAYSKKQGELAKIYADQARHHGEKMKEANRRAAEKILESRNQDLMHSNALDLHELHVNEAIQVLHSVLEGRKNERRRTPSKKLPSYLEVITGRGNRSRDGKPRIKPAVMDYLRRKGYRYEELNSGLYKVFLN